MSSARTLLFSWSGRWTVDIDNATCQQFFGCLWLIDQLQQETVKHRTNVNAVHSHCLNVRTTLLLGKSFCQVLAYHPLEIALVANEKNALSFIILLYMCDPLLHVRKLLVARGGVKHNYETICVAEGG